MALDKIKKIDPSIVDFDTILKTSLHHFVSSASGKAGEKVAKEFDSVVVAKKYMKLYNEILNKSN